MFLICSETQEFFRGFFSDISDIFLILPMGKAKINPKLDLSMKNIMPEKREETSEVMFFRGALLYERKIVC